MTGQTWIDSASSAFEDALAELIGESRPEFDAAEAGRRAALDAVSGAMWAERVGPFYDTRGVIELLGGVSKQAVHDRVRRHRLLALRTQSGRLVYPTCQFRGRDVVVGLDRVLDIVAPDDTEAWYLASWLTTPDPALLDRKPIEALADGDVEPAISAARELAATLRG